MKKKTLIIKSLAKECQDISGNTVGIKIKSSMNSKINKFIH